MPKTKDEPKKKEEKKGKKEKVEYKVPIMPDVI